MALALLPPGRSPEGSVLTQAVTDFYDTGSSDLFDKCALFSGYLGEMRRLGLYQAQYRVTLEGPLDHRIRVRNPFTGAVQEMICFDSNSYLGLHLHPRVVAAVHDALDEVGYGTPSAQMLGGTNRYLCELEEAVSTFLGRAATLIFPSGYAANIGILTGLVRSGDLVVRDRHCHASLNDGCRWAGARHGGIYRHLDPVDCERLIVREAHKARAKLIVTDGIFSMHGRIVPLPELRQVADRQGARLMVDDAHGLGVLGATGRGIEEHFGLPGAVDVLMGTFSKAPGAVGGYVCGSKELIDYLRVFAHAAMFTASLPAATCAGLTTALRVMDEEPEHRARLWSNTRRLWTGLRQAGLSVPALESPILPVFMGHEKLLWSVSRGLFAAGLKCGNVSYPAVPRGESILRISVSARHTADDLDRAVETIREVAGRFGILNLSPAEIRAVGRRVALEVPTLDDTDAAQDAVEEKLS
jgi:4-hydroxy-2,2'-bipyrrole-5-methanol synthase